MLNYLVTGHDLANFEPKTRRLRLNGQSTSIRLEHSFWMAIDALAENEGVSTPVYVSRLHSEIIEHHGEARNFTSLLRCKCLDHISKLVPTGATRNTIKY
ncbi:MAG: ribbon-helix-helix domain-containing protein [Roseibium sp.]